MQPVRAGAALPGGCPQSVEHDPRLRVRPLLRRRALDGAAVLRDLRSARRSGPRSRGVRAGRAASGRGRRGGGDPRRPPTGRVGTIPGRDRLAGPGVPRRPRCPGGRIGGDAHDRRDPAAGRYGAGVQFGGPPTRRADLPRGAHLRGDGRQVARRARRARHRGAHRHRRGPRVRRLVGGQRAPADHRGRRSVRGGRDQHGPARRRPAAGRDRADPGLPRLRQPAPPAPVGRLHDVLRRLHAAAGSAPRGTGRTGLQCQTDRHRAMVVLARCGRDPRPRAASRHRAGGRGPVRDHRGDEGDRRRRRRGAGRPGRPCRGDTGNQTEADS